MKLEELHWQDLVFAYCVFLWIWYVSFALTGFSIIPMQLLAPFVVFWGLSLFASVPYAIGYLVWRFKNKKRGTMGK